MSAMRRWHADVEWNRLALNSRFNRRPGCFTAYLMSHITMIVTTGLDPVVHAEMPCTRRCLMDTRVKPAYDGSARVARLERAKAGMGYLSRRHGASPSPARPTPFVTTGLDPVVHAEMPYPGEVAWIRGSSPRMTDQHA